MVYAGDDMMIPSREVIRAAGATLQYAEAVTVGDEPLIIDLPLPPTPGCHWIVETGSMIANLTLRTPNDPTTVNGVPPLTGLYLCPANTPRETLAEAVAGWNRFARPILLPLGPPGGDLSAIGAAGPPFPFALTLAAGLRVTVPFQWFLRAIVVAAAGTAAPGPGIGSAGRFSVTATLESDDACKVTAP